jgi:hypothetical protein
LQLGGRAHARSVVASLLSLWLLACVALGARHATEAGHWADRQGQLHHSIHSSCTNDGPDADMHAATGRLDHDACELAAARHVFARPTVAVLPAAQPPDRALAWIAATDDVVVASTGRYRLAPKTSPPTT